MSFSDVTLVTNHFATANEGFSTTTSGTVSSGASTVGLNSVSGLTNGSVFVGVIEPGEVKEQVFTGVVDTGGSQITGVVWTKGDNVAHATGVSIVDYDTGTGFNMLSKGVRVSLDQDGTLKAGAVDTAGVLASNVVTTAKILDANVTTAKIANANVTADKLATGAAADYDAGASATTSGSYALLADGLSTAVTVVVGDNGLALVSISALMGVNTGSFTGWMGFAVSGATTVAATDTMACAYQAWTTNTSDTRAATFLVTGLTPGSNTFTLQYHTNATLTCTYRRIAVVPL